MKHLHLPFLLMMVTTLTIISCRSTKQVSSDQTIQSSLDMSEQELLQKVQGKTTVLTQHRRHRGLFRGKIEEITILCKVFVRVALHRDEIRRTAVLLYIEKKSAQTIRCKRNTRKTTGTSQL